MPPHNAKPQTLLIAPDRQRSTLATYHTDHLQGLKYSPYGLLPLPNPLTPASKYNGEIFDSGCDGYLLGNGHRVYSPTLMRFHSCDRLSPFGKGGLNGYVYCNNDPINYSDPTGQAKFQRSRPGLFQRGLEWTYRQGQGIGDWFQRSTDRLFGRRGFPEFQENTDANQPSTVSPPDYSALPLEGQKTIHHPYETNRLISSDEIDKSRSTLDTLIVKHMILEQRTNNPERQARHEQDMTNLIDNERRMIKINSAITLSEPPEYNEAIRNNQERLT